jgi:hypothetical protein
MNKLSVFVDRLKWVGVDIKLTANYPWVYIDEINGNRVTEMYQGNHGFTLGFEPIKPDGEFTFTDLSEIFKLIRKYA